MSKIQLSRNKAIDRFNKRIWTTSEGTTMKMVRMSNQHIINTINFIHRAQIDTLITRKKLDVCYGLGKDWLPVLMKEARTRMLDELLMCSSSTSENS